MIAVFAGSYIQFKLLWQKANPGLKAMFVSPESESYRGMTFAAVACIGNWKQWPNAEDFRDRLMEQIRI
jgi:hypothetical protein